MKLIDMKMPKKTKEELKEMDMPSTIGSEQDAYPYGLNISFEKESIDKIPFLQSVEANTPILIQATGFIKEVSIQDTAEKGRSRHRVEIQLQKVGIINAKDRGKMNSVEYRQSRGI
jgi:hypothetical protein